MLCCVMVWCVVLCYPLEPALDSPLDMSPPPGDVDAPPGDVDGGLGTTKVDGEFFDFFPPTLAGGLFPLGCVTETV